MIKGISDIMRRKIDISHRTVVFITVFFLALWLIYLIRDLLLLLFVAVILMSALSPLVRFFTRIKVPKALSIILTYIIIIGVITAILASFITPLIEESVKLINTLPPLLAQQFNITLFDQNILQSQVADLSKNLFSITLAIFDNIITIIFLLVITFYLLLEREKLEERTAALFVNKEKRLKELMVKIEEKLGAWVRGQLTLSLIIGILAYLGLVLINIPYALPLALLAAVMEVVPVIGPIIAAIPAVALAFIISPILAAVTALVYFIIQILENNLIVPQVMKRAVGLNPLAVILAIAVGGRLLGIAGALLAVPIVVVLQIIVSEILEDKKFEV